MWLLDSSSPRFSLETEAKGRRGGRQAEGGGGEAEPDGESDGGMDGVQRKRAVLSVAFRYLDTYRELLQEEGERNNSFPKVTARTLS